MNKIGKFFVLCSGANRNIIDSLDEEYRPTAINTFIGIGGAVFFTACMAMLSASFAVQTFIDNIYVVLGIALFWGILIFNLDRYIVSSMRKRPTKWEEIVIALPRIIIALLFAVVISKPLELAIFDSGIETQLPKIGDNRTQSIRIEIDSIKNEIDSLIAVNQKYNQDPSTAFVDSAQKRSQNAQNNLQNLTKRLNPSIRKLEREVQGLYFSRKNLRQEIQELTRKIRQYEEASQDIETPPPFTLSQLNQYEASKKSKENKLRNVRYSISRKSKEIRTNKKQIGLADSSAKIANQKFEKEYQSREDIVKLEIANNQDKIASLESLIQSKEENRQVLANGYDDLIARLEGLEALKEDEPIVKWADWLIFLLFITVETAPVLVKLITPKTQYDVRLAAFEETEKLTRRTQDVDQYWDAEKEKLNGEIVLLKKIHRDYRSILEDYIDKSMEHLRAEEERRFKRNKTGYALRMVSNPKDFFNRTEDFLRDNSLNEDQVLVNSIPNNRQRFEWNFKSVSIGFLSMVLVALFYLLYLSTSQPQTYDEKGGPAASNFIENGNPETQKEETRLVMQVDSLAQQGIDSLSKPSVTEKIVQNPGIEIAKKPKASSSKKKRSARADALNQAQTSNSRGTIKDDSTRNVEQVSGPPIIKGLDSLKAQKIELKPIKPIKGSLPKPLDPLKKPSANFLKPSTSPDTIGLPQTMQKADSLENNHKNK